MASSSSQHFDVAVDDRGPLVGRGLVAARDLPAGHVALVDLPALVISAPDASHAVCASCLRSLEDAEPRRGRLACPGCSCGGGGGGCCFFCSPECLASRAGAPGFHTPALCRALQVANYQGLPDADAASSLRFVLTAAALRVEAESSAAAAAALGALASMSAPEASVARLGGQELALRARAALEGTGIRPPSSQEVGRWLAVEEANGFAALSSPSPSSAAAAPPPPQLAPPRVRGTCFYPRAFLFNHDCLPNVARFDDFDGRGHGAALEAAISRAPGVLGGAGGGGGVGGAEFFRSATQAQRRTALVAVTLHPLPRGEELRLSYVPIGWGAAERAGRLAACYGFGCRCARCLGELEAFGGAGETIGGASPSSSPSPSPSPLDEETAAAISGAASWAREPFVAEAAAREALAAALRLATEGARPSPRAAFSSSPEPASATPAEIGYIRAFLAKFSCPVAPRKGSAQGEDEDDDDDECGGTLAPVAAAGGSSSSSSTSASAPPPPPPPTHYQCNSCGFVRSEEDFLRSLAALDDDGGSDYDDDDEEEMVEDD